MGSTLFTKETSSKFVCKILIRRRTPHLFNVAYFAFHTEFRCSFSLFTHFKLIQSQLYLIMPSVKVETSSISQFPIPLRVLLARIIVCILNYFTSVLFLSQRNAELRIYLALFALTYTWCSPFLKSGVGLGSRIASFHVQTVAPVMLVKPTDTSPLFPILTHLTSCSLCTEGCFEILDSASTSFQLKIKEAMHILWEQPSLNFQSNIFIYPFHTN